MKKKFHLPKPGDEFPPLENDLKPPSPDDQDAVNYFLQRAGQDDAFKKTAKAVEEYENNFNNSWLPNYQSARLPGPTGKIGDPNAVPPSPPHGFMAVAIEGEGGGIQYESQQIGPPACEIPAYTKITAPQH